MNKKLLLLLVIAMVGIPLGMLYYVGARNTSQLQHFSPQKPQLFSVGLTNNQPINVLATTLPEFAIKLPASEFANLWQAHAAGSDITASAQNLKGDTKLSFDTRFHDTQKEIIVTPLTQNAVKPGLYTLKVKVKTVTGKDITITQDFSWGVLAINTNKGIYIPGEQVKIGMAVLDDLGETKCIAKGTIIFGTAKVVLTITSPSGKTQQFSTDDGSITGSKSCADRSVTDSADFLTTTQATEVGKYTIHMEAETVFGTKSIDDFFLVQQSVPFVIERVTYPTRIYPRVNYPVNITVTANKDYSGTVSDELPANFKLSQISDNGSTQVSDDFQTVSWNVDFKQGQTYYLSYTITFPPVAPEFYLIGPLTIGNFSERREWQVASDAVFSLVQEAHTITASTNTGTATFTSTPTQGHLLVMVCMKQAKTKFATLAGWSKAYSTNPNANPGFALYYAIAPASAARTFTCTTTGTAGEFAEELLEFSGNSTSGTLDKTSAINSVNCSGGCRTVATNTLTPTNTDELLISSFLSGNGNLTVSSHTAVGGSSIGFADTATSGFADAGGTYDSGWAEIIKNPPVANSDTATFSGAPGNGTLAGIVAFNSTINVSQGSFRFFDNANSTTPAGVLAASNTNITLASPNYPFRLRVLVDVDSSSGNTLAIDAADFILKYAQLPSSGNCNTLATTDLTPVATTSAIAYYPNNATFGNLTPISSTTNDPVDTPTYTTVLENYMELFTSDDPGNDVNNRQNAIANNQAGEWDFSLIDNTLVPGSVTYCLILTNADGSFLTAYNHYPEISTKDVDVFITGGTTLHGSPGTNGTLIR